MEGKFVFVLLEVGEIGDVWDRGNLGKDYFCIDYQNKWD